MATKSKLFRENLRHHMVTQGLSQRVVAERAGTTHGHINRILNGLAVPGLDMAERLSSVVGVPLEGLIAERPEILEKTG